jgi:hypothetical protein
LFEDFANFNEEVDVIIEDNTFITKEDIIYKVINHYFQEISASQKNK